MKRRIQIAQPFLGKEEHEAAKDPISSGWLTSGPKVKEFEENFAAYHGVKHAVAVTSATTALHLSLVALGVGPGDEVIVPSFTWIATANAVKYVGAKPVFVDIDLETFNIKVDDVKRCLTSKTRAIIPVHLFGLCSDIESLKKIAPEIPIVEDAACAAGAKYNDQFAGGLGDLGCFSFHPRKIITTGEGGMITTNDDYLASILKKLRNHGAEISEEERHRGPKPYILPEFNMLGYNFRMTDLQAAIGVKQLEKLERLVKQRNDWAKFYNDQFEQTEWIQTPKIPESGLHSFQSYVILIKESLAPSSRNSIMEKLQSLGISTRPGTHSVHLLNYYKNQYGFLPEDYPNSLEAHNSSIAIPLHNLMLEEDFFFVSDTLKSI